jgi:glycerophosphoryl diester phosphodiesterase
LENSNLIFEENKKNKKMIRFLLFLSLVSFVSGDLGQPYGGNVLVAPCDSSDVAQHWQYDASTGQIRTATALHQNQLFCWDIEPGATLDNANIQLFDCDDKRAQRFTFGDSFVRFDPLHVASVAGAFGQNVAIATLTSASDAQPQWTWLVDSLNSSSSLSLLVKVGSEQRWCAAAGPLDAEVSPERASPLVVGHRGTTVAHAENTLPAFRYALAGADGFETDLQLTRDGHIVLIHDDTMDRTTNCSGPVAALTLAEIERCDACSWFDPSAHCNVPTFEQALDLMQTMVDAGEASPSAFMVMDLKVEGLAAGVAKAVAERGADYIDSRLLASCRTQTQVNDFGAAVPSIARHRLLSDLPSGWQQPKFWHQEVLDSIRGYSLYHPKVTAEFRRAAHSHMMSVFTWTIEQEGETVDQLKANNDGVIANNCLFTNQMLTKLRQQVQQ